ncbi:MAG: excinuclease ABC subunit UvrC [Rhodospirillales bacterium]|nr:excinuclease ABC subunit UvrC [Rhodospirillales bacterium]
MSEDSQENPLENGVTVIRRLVKILPDQPGVYRMLDEAGEVLYVGKAKSLKKRVVSYTRPDKLPGRLQRMITATRDMMFVTTHTEAEALLLEANLIKKLKPRYNVLLRDDKSFPYILITGDHDFPLLTKHRGAQKRKGDYFGPFANAGAVNRTIAILQKAFMLRNCSDSVFAARTRPCLQYQIKRCTAPCVNFCTKDEYAAQVRQARDFLSGESKAIQAEMAAAMQQASTAQDYEAAAGLRDRIKALAAVQGHQDINIPGMGDADVFGLFREGGRACVQVFFFRAGQNFGNRAYFPRASEEDTDGLLLSAFIAQFYANKPPPKEILVSCPPEDETLLAEALAVSITQPRRGAKKRLADFVVRNAREALERESLKLAGEQKNREAVAELFAMAKPPQRIEVYDNSHISGTNMVGAMVVAGPEGFRKSAYRKFNIRRAKESDDYGMMREVMERRFSRSLKDGSGPGSEDWPDLLLIDGGKGQLSVVMEVLEALGVAGDVTVVGIAKGPDRNAGREQFFMPGREPFQLPIDDPALHYLQRLRDEVHRFAIGAHRARRSKDIARSPLDDIPGIGAQRKKALLMHFGSAQAVTTAGIKDLQAVDGISKAVAEKIYGWFHQV